MEIFLENIKLDRVNFFDEEKICYIEKLIEDDEIRKYLSYLKDGISISKNIGYLNSHYIVKKDSEYIGYLYLSPPFIKDYKTSSEIRYAIDSMYRNCGLGSMLVKEVSEFILNEEKLGSLTAVINKQNIVSQHIVEKNGYIRGVEDIDGIVFEKSNFKR